MLDANARREARRRKILENSERRLERITGVQKRNASFELEGYKNCIHIEDEEQMHNTNSLNNSFLPEQSENLASSQLETPLRTSAINSFSQSTKSDQFFFIKTYRTHIVLGIACLLNLCSLILPKQFSINTIFIPLLCFEALDVICNQHYQKNDGLINLFRIFFRNIPSNYLSLMVKYFSLGVTITRDVMIYFFAYVCIWFITDKSSNIVNM